MEECRSLSKEFVGNNIEQAKKLGASRIILFCSPCYPIYKFAFPEENIIYFPETIIEATGTLECNQHIDYYAGCYKLHRRFASVPVDLKSTNRVFNSIKGLAINRISAPSCCFRPDGLAHMLDHVQTDCMVHICTGCYSQAVANMPKEREVNILMLPEFIDMIQRRILKTQSSEGKRQAMAVSEARFRTFFTRRVTPVLFLTQNETNLDARDFDNLNHFFHHPINGVPDAQAKGQHVSWLAQWLLFKVPTKDTDLQDAEKDADDLGEHVSNYCLVGHDAFHFSNAAIFSAADVYFRRYSNFNASLFVMPELTPTTYTGTQDFVYFAPLPELCFNSRLSKSLVMPQYREPSTLDMLMLKCRNHGDGYNLHGFCSTILNNISN